MKKILPIIVIALFFVGCKKEYTVTFRQMEMRGDTLLTINTDTKTIEASNDEEAAREAYTYYIAKITTGYQMKGDSFYWVPLTYIIRNKNGDQVDDNIHTDEDLKHYYVPSDHLKWYRSATHMLFFDTPYFQVNGNN